MNLIQCVKAYEAVLALGKQEQVYKTAYALMMLKRNLQPHVDFFIKKEMELVEEYATKDEKGNIIVGEGGRFTFREPEKAVEYAKRREELGSVEVEGEWPLSQAPAPKTIKPAHLEALEGFLSFADTEGQDL